MDLTAIFIVISFLAFLLIFWLVFGVKSLEHSNEKIFLTWINLKKHLSKRYSRIVLLIWIIQKYDGRENEICDDLFKIRDESISEKYLSNKKINLELQLSEIINKSIDYAKEKKEIKNNGYFWEIKTDIDSLENTIEKLENEYNDLVLYYNEELDSFIYKPIKLLFRYKEAKEFRFEI